MTYSFYHGILFCENMVFTLLTNRNPRIKYVWNFITTLGLLTGEILPCRKDIVRGETSFEGSAAENFEGINSEDFGDRFPRTGNSLFLFLK